MQYRMYFFLPYHLSGIQKGIQAGHAALEYAYKYGNTQEYKSFIENDKTWILLNGGTSRSYNGNFDNAGTLNQILHSLICNQVPTAYFAEPDLNYTLTAVCLLADERVWDFENYPEPLSQDIEMSQWTKYLNNIGGEKNLFIRTLIKDKHLA